MCGILAVVGHVEKSDFLTALNLQSHRGPDDYGYTHEASVHLGHRRLSIIDLNRASKQPMTAGQGLLSCIFNGEIYNYKEIKSTLLKNGYKFNTESDTEVLINAYHFWGENCLHHFIGMFAFVIFDKRDGSIFVARDRLGVKPLYYSNQGGKLIFSSEIKSIKSISKSDYNLNLLAVSSYLSYRYPIANDTFYTGISQLPPAHYIKVSADLKMQVHKYWDFSEKITLQQEDRGEAYYLEKLEELFTSSVRYRMIADVPVGAYLSGGVDSSAVVAAMAKESNSPIQTFTIGFDEAGYNEFEYAREVAERYNTNHHEIILSGDDYIETMENLIQLKDAPLGVPNEVPLYLMSKELKKYITVVLSGEGADEIFGGYGRIFRAADEYEKLLRRDSGTASQKLVESLNSKYGDLRFSSELDHFIHLYQYTSTQQKASLLGPAFNLKEMESELRSIFSGAFNQTPAGSTYVNKMMYAFEKLHLPGLLQRVDTTTMGASVEARVPFVDHRLVEFAFSIPTKYKLHWTSLPRQGDDLISESISETLDIPKYILKKSQAAHLSERVLYRKKMGFPVPLNRWFGGAFNSYAKNTLMNGTLVSEGLLKRDSVLNLLENPALEKNHTLAMRVWMLINLELFIKNF